MKLKQHDTPLLLFKSGRMTEVVSTGHNIILKAYLKFNNCLLPAFS